MATRSKFYRWLMKNYKPYKSRIGDVAGDIKDDSLFDPSWNYEEMKEHFYKMEASNNFLDAFEFAYLSFQEEQKSSGF